MNTPANTRPDRIVVVDDDARIRDLLRRYLTQEGFEVLLAEDAKALNRLLTRETVHLIVLDLMLPGADGLSICRRLRAANDLTPIIMLTAKVEDVDRIVGLEVGADDYLPKPFNPRELLARIHAVLRRRPSLEAPGATTSTRSWAWSWGPTTTWASPSTRASWPPACGPSTAGGARSTRRPRPTRAWSAAACASTSAASEWTWKGWRSA